MEDIKNRCKMVYKKRLDALIRVRIHQQKINRMNRSQKRVIVK